MTNKILTYHAATKELQYEDIRLNAISMHLPDEDDGKKFVEGVDFTLDGWSSDRYLAIPIQKQESEDELWGEMLKMTLPISLDAAQNKVKNPKQYLIDHLKQCFTIKRK